VSSRERGPRSGSRTRLALDPSRGLPTVAHAYVGKRERRLVSLTFASWNQIREWLRRLDAIQRVA
jgi:hypothetical protein